MARPAGGTGRLLVGAGLGGFVLFVVLMAWWRAYEGNRPEVFPRAFAYRILGRSEMPGAENERNAMI